MAAEKELARKAKLYINTGDHLTIESRTVVSGTGAVWTQIENITDLNPTRGERNEDTSDYDDAGEDSDLVTSRNLQLAVTYNYRADPADGSRPVGQAALEALTDEIGSAAVGQFKWVPSPNSPVRIFNANVGASNGPGGATNAIGKVSHTIRKTGQFYKGVEPA